MSIFKGQDVKALQNFLKARNVTFSGQNKATLLELCEGAKQIGIEVDPDGLLENREEVIKEKLLHGGVFFNNPGLLQCSPNIAIILLIGQVDIINYLLSFESYGYVRDLKKTEAYGLFKDGYVIDISCAKYVGLQYFCLKSKVKPRTKTKNPLTGLSYIIYSLWIILTDCEDAGRILLAFCNCKGG